MQVMWRKILRNKVKKEFVDLQNVDTSTAEYQYISSIIKKHPVVMFSKVSCKFCGMAREVLDGVGVHYHVEDIGEKENCQPIQDVFKQITGERTVRTIAVILAHVIMLCT